MKCPEWFRQIVTEPDNKTVCPLRIIALLGSLQYLGLSVAHYIQHAIFEPQAFAVGFGALLGGAGVALGVKKNSNEKQ